MLEGSGRVDEVLMEESVLVVRRRWSEIALEPVGARSRREEIIVVMPSSSVLGDV